MFHEFIYESGCTKVPDVQWKTVELSISLKNFIIIKIECRAKLETCHKWAPQARLSELDQTCRKLAKVLPREDSLVFFVFKLLLSNLFQTVAGQL